MVRRLPRLVNCIAEEVFLLKQSVFSSLFEIILQSSFLEAARGIEAEETHCYHANIGERLYCYAVGIIPGKMFVPSVNSWVEEANEFLGVWFVRA